MKQTRFNYGWVIVGASFALLTLHGWNLVFLFRFLCGRLKRVRMEPFAGSRDVFTLSHRAEPWQFCCRKHDRPIWPQKSVLSGIGVRRNRPGTLQHDSCLVGVLSLFRRYFCPGCRCNGVGPQYHDGPALVQGKERFGHRDHLCRRRRRHVRLCPCRPISDQPVRLADNLPDHGFHYSSNHCLHGDLLPQETFPVASIRALRKRDQPVLCLVPDAPPLLDEGRASPSWTLKQAVKTRPFQLLTLSIISGTLATQAILTHQVAFFTDQGLGNLLASYVVGVIGLVSIGAKIFWGILSDKNRTGENLHIRHYLRCMRNGPAHPFPYPSFLLGALFLCLLVRHGVLGHHDPASRHGRRLLRGKNLWSYFWNNDDVQWHRRGLWRVVCRFRL